MISPFIKSPYSDKRVSYIFFIFSSLNICCNCPKNTTAFSPSFLSFFAIVISFIIYLLSSISLLFLNNSINLFRILSKEEDLISIFSGLELILNNLNNLSKSFKSVINTNTLSVNVLYKDSLFSNFLFQSIFFHSSRKSSSNLFISNPGIISKDSFI